MNSPFRRLKHRLLSLALAISLLGAGLPARPAWASIQKIEESPQQVVYQSRHKLYDRNSHLWQSIAFKRMGAAGSEDLQLRLVGFPGVAAIEHPRPLTIELPSGELLIAEDRSAAAFADQSPQANVGQYNLQPIADQLPDRFQVILVVPLQDGTTAQLGASLIELKEWKQLANQT